MAENIGMANLAHRLKDEQKDTKKYISGVLPRDSIENAKFAVNFFTSIGLGHITEDLREFLKEAPKILLEQKYAEMLAEAQRLAEMSSSSSGSDSSSSSSNSSSKSSTPSNSRSA